MRGTVRRRRRRVLVAVARDLVRGQDVRETVEARGGERREVDEALEPLDRPGLLQRLDELGGRADDRRQPLGDALQPDGDGLRGVHRPPAHDRHLRQLPQRRAGGVGERVKVREERPDRGRRGAHVPHHRGRVGGELVEPRGERLELVEQRRQPADRLAQVSAAARHGARHRVGALDEARDVAVVPRHLADHRVGAIDQARERVAVAVQDREHAVRLSERRVGAVDRGAEVLRTAREPGAELVHEDRQPLAVRAPQRGEDQVEVDGRVRARERHGRRVPALRDERPPARRAGVALHELLADEALRADAAVRVRAEGREVAGDLHLDTRLAVAGQLDSLDAPDLGPGDLHVLARDQEARVVEDRIDAVGAPAAPPARANERGDAGREQDEEHDGAPHRNVSCWRHGKSERPSR